MTNKAPSFQSQRDTELLWIQFHKSPKSPFSMAVLSWPMNCQSVAVALPDDCQTEEQAVAHLAKIFADQLKNSLKK